MSLVASSMNCVLLTAGAPSSSASPAAALVWIVAARRAWHGGGDLSWVIVGTLGVLAIIAVWMLARWWLGEGSARMRNSPKALFLELCRAHSLAASERQLLAALAECRRLAQPSDLFVDPRHFDEAALPPSLASRKGELARLSERLFAGLSQVDDGADAATQDGRAVV